MSILQEINNPKKKLNHGIIRVVPVPERIVITWMIGSRCNYDCMYCPNDIHDMVSPHPDLEQMKRVWHSMHQKTQHLGIPYKVSLTGGEVTANKSLLPMIEYLRRPEFNVGEIFVTTNGSASVNYYKKLAALVNGIGFSTHTEFFDESKFFPTVLAINKIMIRPEKSIQVNIMDEYWAQDRIKIYCEWLDRHGIAYSVNKINHAVNTRDFPKKEGVLNFDFSK
jgi:organic radical activating enzyme